jgi:hypothetical protein
MALLAGMVAPGGAAFAQTAKGEAETVVQALTSICGWHYVGTGAHALLLGSLRPDGWRNSFRNGVQFYDTSGAWGRINVKIGGSGSFTRCSVTVTPSDPAAARDGEAVYAAVKAFVAAQMPAAKQTKDRTVVETAPDVRVSAWSDYPYAMQVGELPAAAGKPVLQVYWDRQ